MSYWGFLAPITPATTGPMLIPEKYNFGYVISQPKQKNCISFVSFLHFTNPYQKKNEN
jgi:hypothetical protein